MLLNQANSLKQKLSSKPRKRSIKTHNYRRPITYRINLQKHTIQQTRTREFRLHSSQKSTLLNLHTLITSFPIGGSHRYPEYTTFSSSMIFSNNTTPCPRFTYYRPRKISHYCSYRKLSFDISSKSQRCRILTNTRTLRSCARPFAAASFQILCGDHACIRVIRNGA